MPNVSSLSKWIIRSFLSKAQGWSHMSICQANRPSRMLHPHSRLWVRQENVNGVRCWRCVRKTYPRCHFAKFDCHWGIGSRQCSNYTWPNRDGTGAVARRCLSTNCGQLMWRNQCKKDPPDCAAGWNKSTGKNHQDSAPRNLRWPSRNWS